MAIIFNSLPVIPLRVTSKFGPRNTGIAGASTYHKGIDLGRNFAEAKTPILSVAPGTVTQNYWNDYRGWVVVIDHGEFKTLYQHLDGQGIKQGSVVTAGDRIGIMGNSSNPKKLKVAMHLHFELHYRDKILDPEPYLKNIVPLVNEEEEEEMKRYNKVSELPKSLQPEAQQLVDSGVLKGDEKGNLDVTEDMIRSMIISKRYADMLNK